MVGFVWFWGLGVSSRFDSEAALRFKRLFFSVVANGGSLHSLYVVYLSVGTVPHSQSCLAAAEVLATERPLGDWLTRA